MPVYDRLSIGKEVVGKRGMSIPQYKARVNVHRDYGNKEEEWEERNGEQTDRN